MKLANSKPTATERDRMAQSSKHVIKPEDRTESAPSKERFLNIRGQESQSEK